MAAVEVCHKVSVPFCKTWSFVRCGGGDNGMLIYSLGWCLGRVENQVLCDLRSENGDLWFIENCGGEEVVY